MAEYVPIYHPGAAVPVTLSGTVTAGQALKVSGSATVAANAAASTYIVGVAAQDGVSGDKITMWGRGRIHRLTAAGAITAADLVEGAAAGAVATHTVGTNDARVFGIALTTAADTAAVEVMEV